MEREKHNKFSANCGKWMVVHGAPVSGRPHQRSDAGNARTTPRTTCWWSRHLR